MGGISKSDDRDGEVGGLIRLLERGGPDERAAAAEKLCQMGTAAAGAAVTLVRACADHDDRVRDWSVAALEGIEQPPVEDVPILVTIIGSGVTLATFWAITLLGRVPQAAAPAVAKLADCVGSSADRAVRERAAWALGQIGPAAAGARAILEQAAGESQPRLARLAREALAAIDAA
ncbi:MAG: HEAT repeat domain-containing protein [Planctomycetaceae bacterium]